MFSLDYDGQVINFNFEHDKDTLVISAEDEPVERRFTKCYMTRVIKKDGEKPQYHPLHVSIAICNKCDNFSKSMGRKVALAKLLKERGEPRDFRVAVWDEYFKHTKRV